MGNTPDKPQQNQREDGQAERNMESHSPAGWTRVNVRHEPDNWELNRQKSHDKPVKNFRWGTVVQSIVHKPSFLNAGNSPIIGKSIVVRQTETSG